tara:strand:- start:2129 stop:2479 length:351 start_codon:yes stop_codon:yes gene_type:complete
MSDTNEIANLVTGLEVMSVKFSSLEEKLSSLDKKIDELIDKFTGQLENNAVLNEKIQRVETENSNMDRRVARLERDLIEARLSLTDATATWKAKVGFGAVGGAVVTALIELTKIFN